jgi:hypothetical protein
MISGTEEYVEPVLCPVTDEKEAKSMVGRAKFHKVSRLRGVGFGEGCRNATCNEGDRIESLTKPKSEGAILPAGSLTRTCWIFHFFPHTHNLATPVKNPAPQSLALRGIFFGPGVRGHSARCLAISVSMWALIFVFTLSMATRMAFFMARALLLPWAMMVTPFTPRSGLPP